MLHVRLRHHTQRPACLAPRHLCNTSSPFSCSSPRRLRHPPARPTPRRTHSSRSSGSGTPRKYPMHLCVCAPNARARNPNTKYTCMLRRVQQSRWVSVSEVRIEQLLYASPAPALRHANANTNTNTSVGSLSTVEGDDEKLWFELVDASTDVGNQNLIDPLEPSCLCPPHTHTHTHTRSYPRAQGLV